MQPKKKIAGPRLVKLDEMQERDFSVLLELVDSDPQGGRAQRVLESFLMGTTQGISQSWWQKLMDEQIAQDLDHKSIGPFVEKILQFHTKIAQSIKANKAHVEHHAMRDDIYKWLDANKTSGMTLDDAALAMAQKIIPLKFRAVREHCTAWNKLQKEKLRSAGKAQ